MSILIDERTRIVVQGMTGREGRLRSRLMRQAGAVITAGVTPGKGGETLDAIPIYDTVKEARLHHPEINASLVVVPSRSAKDATIEAIAAGIGVIGLMPERLPHHDAMEIISFARLHGALVIGPNSPGVLSPGKSSLGGLGGRIEMMQAAFLPGRIGIISRSGGNTMTLAYYLAREGYGVSTAVGVGGDAFVVTSWRTLLEMFQDDADTDAVVAYGEIGGVNEEEAAAAIESGAYTKPLVAYIGGRSTQPGMRFGHAGAIVSATSGSAAGKIDALRSAGAVVIEHLDEVGPVLASVLQTAIREPESATHAKGALHE